MKLLEIAALCSIALLALPACKKDNGGGPDNKEPEYFFIDKITGPVIWEHFPTIGGYGSDSVLFSYNSDNRISHITYFGRTEHAGVTKSYRSESDITYDAKGNVQKISLQGDPDVPEKEVSFQYDAAGNTTKAKLVFRTYGAIKENDSVVHIYHHRFENIFPPVINGQAIKDWVSVSTEYYGDKDVLRGYLRGYEIGGMAYNYYLNKDNIPIQIWKVHDYFSATVYENLRYEVTDSNIVAVKTYTNDLNAQGAPSDIDTYERTDIPDVNFQITKSIFGRNFWITNIGSFSPFHTMQVSTFVKTAGQGATALHFSFDIDSSAKRITQSYRDQFGVYQPLTKYYFR
ncbi:MAG TPA: hypothetical protein VD996_12240 [Chitinophagaceae bacterium]|nr:hypothetical protein [Chitinophagaceae bacterium]